MHVRSRWEKEKTRQSSVFLTMIFDFRMPSIHLSVSPSIKLPRLAFPPPRTAGWLAEQ